MFCEGVGQSPKSLSGFYMCYLMVSVIISSAVVHHMDMYYLQECATRMSTCCKRSCFLVSGRRVPDKQTLTTRAGSSSAIDLINTHSPMHLLDI